MDDLVTYATACCTKFDGMVGNTASMQQVRFLIQQVAKTDANVLVLGPSGTGKEVVAVHTGRKVSAR